MKYVLLAGLLALSAPLQAFQDFRITVYNQVSNKDETVPIKLHKPKSQHPALPAVLWFSGCDGELLRGGQTELIKRLNDVGVLVAEVRSLRTRGRPSSVCMNPRLVPEALRATEAFVVREELIKRGYAAPDNLGITGVSHGGRVTNMVALHDSPAAPTEQAFAAAVATYPWCVNDARSFQVRTPLLILAGGRDELTPSRTCENFLGLVSRHEERTGKKNADVVLKAFAGATHAWDVDLLPRTMPFFSGDHYLEFDRDVTNQAVTLSFEFFRKYMRF